MESEYRLRAPTLSEVLERDAGFFAGDGSVFWNGCAIVVSFSQSGKGLSILENLQSRYGGTLQRNSRERENSQREYSLYLYGDTAKSFLETIQHVIRRKKRNVMTALEIIGFRGITRNNKEHAVRRDQLIEKLSYLNNEAHKQGDYESVDTMSHAFAAGLFESEGSVSIRDNGTLRVKITQSSNPHVLKAIRDLYGFGRADLKDWSVEHFENCEKMAWSFLPFTFKSKCKGECLRVLLEYMNTRHQRELKGEAPWLPLEELHAFRERLDELHGGNRELSKTKPKTRTNFKPKTQTTRIEANRRLRNEIQQFINMHLPLEN